jgi:CRISPR-associated protein Cas1
VGARPAGPRGPRLLLTERATLTVLERARVRRDDARVVYDAADDTLTKTYNLPYANMAILLLGQGSSITSDAARLLAEEGVMLGFSGSGGVPLLCASVEAYRPSEHLWRWIRVVGDEGRRLAAAKSMQEARCDNLEALAPELADGLDEKGLRRVTTRYRGEIGRAIATGELLGREGAFAKDVYALLARPAGVDFERRQAERANNPAAGRDPVSVANAAIDHGNYLAYGIAATALWALGIPASLAAMHGKTRAGGLVFDLADAFKDAFVLPLAFDAAARSRRAAFDENAFRARLLDAFDDGRALRRAFAAAEGAVAAAEAAGAGR